MTGELRRLPSEVRFELGVDLLRDAVPGTSTDQRVIAELFLQLVDRQLGDAFGMLAERIHDECLRERAVP